MSATENNASNDAYVNQQLQARWRYRFDGGEWTETSDEHQAMGLFLDLDFDVECVNDEARNRTYGKYGQHPQSDPTGWDGLLGRAP